jgi:hypothetical protein
MAAVDVDSAYYEALKILAGGIPEMAAMFLGMVVALAQWRRYPRPALLSFLAFGIMLVVTILMAFVTTLIPMGIPIEFAFFAGNEDLFFTVAGTVQSFLFAGTYLLLIFAIYAARKPRPPMPPHLPETRLHEVDG